MVVRSLPYLSLTLVALFILPGQALGGRIIGESISLDGKPYLSGRTGDNGRRKGHHIWRDLAVVELHPEEDVVVEPDEDGGTVATLKGRIHIEVLYSSKADVTELRLVRSKKDATAWSVDPEDVERIAKDLGLADVTEDDRKLATGPSGDGDFIEPRLPAPNKASSSPESSQWVPLATVTAACAGIVLAVTYLVCRRRANLRQSSRISDKSGEPDA